MLCLDTGEVTRVSKASVHLIHLTAQQDIGVGVDEVTERHPRDLVMLEHGFSAGAAQMGAAVAQPRPQAGKHLSPRITFGVLDGNNVFNDIVICVHVPAAASLLMTELCVPVPSTAHCAPNLPLSQEGIKHLLVFK